MGPVGVRPWRRSRSAGRTPIGVRPHAGHPPSRRSGSAGTPAGTGRATGTAEPGGVDERTGPATASDWGDRVNPVR